MRQTTIRRQTGCAGIGLHSGKEARLELRPAAEDTGILFHVRTASGSRTLAPSPEAVAATGLASSLNRDGLSVGTVEHLLAALRGLGVDNVHVDVAGGEVPILDGSAAPFAALLAEAGIRVQRKPRRVCRLTAPARCVHGEKSIIAEPYAGFRVDYRIDFPHPLIGRQRLIFELTPASFLQVANARTFGFARDVAALHARGLALGGSLDNAIVLDDEGVMNAEGLRSPDEFVRHKILDFIGDMAMLPLPLTGRFTVNCSGHNLNNEFLRQIAGANLLAVEDSSRPFRAMSGISRRPLSPSPFVPACAG
jgi:UDP-3-O-[3-hydroxymyristoyl] N-acetylglucosamine deacetylase